MQCQQKKANGEQCRANAIPGKTVCPFHDPEKNKQNSELRKRGGENRKRTITLPPGTPPLVLETISDVILALAETFNHVRVGTIDPRVGNCLGVLAAQLVAALKLGPLEERMARLEASLAATREGK